MDWFRPVVSSILLLGAALSMFFVAPLQGPFASWLATASASAALAFALLRALVLLALGYVLSRVSARGPPAAVALVVAGPTLVIGGLMGVFAAVRPLHLLVVALLAAGVLGACLLGALRGTRA